MEKIKKSLCYPLQAMKDNFIYKIGKTVQERGKCLLLSYMCLKDRRMDVQNVDQKLFETLKKKYGREL